MERAEAKVRELIGLAMENYHLARRKWLPAAATENVTGQIHPLPAARVQGAAVNDAEIRRPFHMVVSDYLPSTSSADKPKGYLHPFMSWLSFVLKRPLARAHHKPESVMENLSQYQGNADKENVHGCILTNPDTTILTSPLATIQLSFDCPHSDVYKSYKNREIKVEFGATAFLSRAWCQNWLGVIDWMLKFQDKQAFCPESLYLAVQIFNRYIYVKRRHPNDYREIGATCFLIALKYEESRPAGVSLFPDCNPWLILKREKDILQALKWYLSAPTMSHYLKLFLAAESETLQVMKIAREITRMTLREIHMAHKKPSMLSSSAILLARMITGQSPAWTRSRICYTGYSEPELQPIVTDMIGVGKVSNPKLFRNVK